MSPEDSTSPSGDGPRFTAPGANPPGVRTAGEIAADSERAESGRSAGEADGSASAAEAAPAETGTGSPDARAQATPATDPKAARKAEKQAARDEKKAARAERKAAKSDDATPGGAKGTKGAKEKKPNWTATVRSRLAALIWTIAVVCALVLAIGALLVALQANQDNAAVSFVLRAADDLDLGIFSRDNGIFEFEGTDPEVRNALVNWGLGAVAYLVVGKILDRVVAP